MFIIFFHFEIPRINRLLDGSVKKWKIRWNVMRKKILPQQEETLDFIVWMNWGPELKLLSDKYLFKFLHNIGTYSYFIRNSQRKRKWPKISGKVVFSLTWGRLLNLFEYSGFVWKNTVEMTGSYFFYRFFFVIFINAEIFEWYPLSRLIKRI